MLKRRENVLPLIALGAGHVVNSGFVNFKKRKDKDCSFYDVYTPSYNQFNLEGNSALKICILHIFSLKCDLHPRPRFIL